MASAVDLNEMTRSALGSLVQREERRLGSRDLALEIVAQTVGASSSWVRKFLSRSPEVKEPRITLFLNIRAAYDSLCDRVEKQNRLEELRYRALKGNLNAVTEGFVPESDSQT